MLLQKECQQHLTLAVVIKQNSGNNHKTFKQTLCHLLTVLNRSNNIYSSLFPDAKDIQGTTLPKLINSNAVIHTQDFNF